MTMESTQGQIDGVDVCFAHGIFVTGTGLSPLTVTPPGGSPIDIPAAGIGVWEFESQCFASLAALEAVFPRDEVGTYDFAFGGTSDSDSLSYSSVGFPACLPVITAPSHGAVTSATPTIEWSVGCALTPSSCHYALEEACTEETVDYEFDLESFKEWADWCDILVSDGSTSGLEKRCMYDGVFDVPENAWNQVLRVCQTARAMLVLSGNTFIVKPSAASWGPQVATHSFGMANIIAGTFKKSFLSQADQPTRIEVHFLNKASNYQLDVEGADDPTAIEMGRPQIVGTVERFGITRRSQARREKNPPGDLRPIGKVL